MQENLISFRQIRMAFGEKVVLNNMDLDVRKGETLAVIGPSGSGKSTIIKLLTGLLKPTAGAVFLEEQDVTQFTEAEWNTLRKDMGVVFQYSALFDFLDVAGNVAFGLKRHSDLSQEEIAERVASLLAMVGMPGAEHLKPSELSGGMKKRVGLARALAMRPQIVLYDEPTSGLDPIMTMTISRLIRKMQKQFGVTSILVTHDMESAYEAADRIAMLYDGKIIAVGTVEEIQQSKNKIVQAFINGIEIDEMEKGEAQNG